jgi:hypothetical protein
VLEGVSGAEISGAEISGAEMIGNSDLDYLTVYFTGLPVFLWSRMPARAE